MTAGVRDVVEGRDAGLHIVEDVHLHAALPPAEPCPSKERQAERNRGRIKCIDVAAQPEDLLRAPASGFRHHLECKLLEDAVVAPLVGIGESRLGHGIVPKSKMVAFRLVRLQRDNQVAEALPAAELPEHQHQELVPAGEVFHVMVALVLVDQSPELVVVQKCNQLRKDEFLSVHMRSSRRLVLESIRYRFQIVAL